MIDAHYTSSTVADELLDSLPKVFSAGRIADFAAGDGALLIAASRRFPRAEISYNDIDAPAARRVRRAHIDWRVSVSDFLSARSVASAAYGQSEFDLVLLNPPFSQRGAPDVSGSCGSSVFECSVALGFVARALSFLAPSGCLLAVLPMGCFGRDLDREAWNAISRFHEVHHVRDLDCFAFAKARARTRMVRIVPRSVPLEEVPHVRAAVLPAPNLVRGTFQTHFVDERSKTKRRALVHTTNLVDGRVMPSGRLVRWNRWVEGPAVLVPRVGRLSRGKVCILPEGRSVVLTDCVFAITVESNERAEAVREAIFSRWEVFEMQYDGTGAPYITRERLQLFMSRFRVDATQAQLQMA